MSKSPPPLRLFLIFLTLSALHFLSMFYRFSNAVISPDLVKDLGLNAETLGILGGPLLLLHPASDSNGAHARPDRSPHRCQCFLIHWGIGRIPLCLWKSFFMVFLGRILIGAGMSSALMGSMKVFILYFPPERFATLVSILLSIGTFGSILAASPLAYFTSVIGGEACSFLPAQ